MNHKDHLTLLKTEGLQKINSSAHSPKSWHNIKIMKHSTKLKANPETLDSSDK